MSRAEATAVRVKAFAKINLTLRVLCRRPDQFHELRTVFQTISLADAISVQYQPADSTEISVAGSGIPDNLMVRAARLYLEAAGISAVVRFGLEKRIPMGAGLGGGSSDAAAVLLALPALAGKPLPYSVLMQVAQSLGSDVPFLLMGGAAAGLSRGEELYPLPDRRGDGLLIAPGIHVSTPGAYQALSPRLYAADQQHKLATFQKFVALANVAGHNDFEAVVFEQHPKLELLKSKLLQAGANVALMSGSGSSIFGLFNGRAESVLASSHFREETIFPFSFVRRSQFRAAWGKWLAPFTIPNTWPPRSRFAR
jgi:4-diphosphocytidyl-2-C-methyl-D-erythritol kinase